MVAETNLPGILTCNGLIFVGKEHTTKSMKIYTPRKFLRIRVIKNFEGTEEDGDLVAETNLPGILTCNGLIFVGKEHTTKYTKIYTPRKFLRIRVCVYMHTSD